jgi:6-pyruvoyl tetrahydropterin synthase/QueD family protein
MFYLTKRFTFEASHQLVHHDGVCANLHGHSYSFTLEALGPLEDEGPKKNMVLDYADLGSVGKSIHAKLDHRFLNEVFNEDMVTAEYIAKWIYDQAKLAISRLVAVEVSETATTTCRYSPMENRLLEIGQSEIEKIRERVYENIAVGEPDACWLWTSAKDELGYGYSKSKIAGTNKAHRLVLWLEGIDIEGRVVIHSCDQPSCCNPKHLRAGSHRENEIDKDCKGRRPKGEEAGSSKLTDQQVTQLWEDYQNGPRSRGFSTEWAKRLGVTPNAISNILSGWSWNHITRLTKKYAPKSE